jgi:hypothetical protein
MKIWEVSVSSKLAHRTIPSVILQLWFCSVSYYWHIDGVWFGETVLLAIPSHGSSAEDSFPRQGKDKRTKRQEGQEYEDKRTRTGGRWQRQRQWQRQEEKRAQGRISILQVFVQRQWPCSVLPLPQHSISMVMVMVMVMVCCTYEKSCILLSPWSSLGIMCVHRFYYTVYIL